MIAIIDYDAGNIGSVANALNRLGVSNYEITSDKNVIKNSKGVIFPGQGRAGPAMQSLQANGLDELLPTLKQPFIGICLGMQLIMDSSEEDNSTALGIIPGTCRKLATDLPIPQMGWNKLEMLRDSSLLNNLDDEPYVYFANSYAVATDNSYVDATVMYGQPIVSAIEKDNFYGIQFHPEKSGAVGETILSNFLKLCEQSS